MNKQEFLAEYAVARKNTDSVKWDNLKETFDAEDLLPLWVADTEFKAPKEALEAMTKRIAHGAFGYSLTPDAYFEAYFKWQKERYGIELHREWMRFGTGVVQSLSTLVNLLTQKDDAVLVLQPVYYPFMKVIENNERKLVVSDLKNEAGVYSMDLADIEEKITEEQVKLLILCSPHNPVGRVWSEAELAELLELCRQKQVLVIADEIHHDLLLTDKPFVSALEVSEGKYRDNLVVVDAPSKTFNMAALQNSHVIIPNPQIRQRYDKLVERLAAPAGSILGKVAAAAAYEHGASWLEGLLETIQTNYDYVKENLTKAYPQIVISPLEGTYLMWIDLSAVVDPAKLELFVKNKAGLAVDFGDWFGASGAGHIRINLATTPENIERAVTALLKALDENQS
ncbi:MAG: PatB family C-S lyase [Ligilactobacillus animalis]|uniref:MalY/PatB family protein n=1 Tax=Ligilactobacillus animalis TaxID=1605 RepID=UPI00242B9984|nr:PatB family C-S lyase [Ligilactobacillus animalis]MCI5941958.1 PatB family C-S lyase [Ligilactobacillus animalis]MDY2993542.1 PatB family C-S lyase [Ligilactobacillus animalis]